IGSLAADAKENHLFRYFEVKVLKLSSEEHVPVRIGLAATGYPRFHMLGSMKRSVGYQSDGWVSLGHRDGELFQYAAPWGEGDTIGCGYLLTPTTTGTIFFTKNGHWVGDIPYMIRDEPHNYLDSWRAAVSSTGPATLSINMGQLGPFSYAPANGNGSDHLVGREEVVPTKEDWEGIERMGVKAWKMQPVCLPAGTDTYRAAEVDERGLRLRFFDNGEAVARSCQSLYPIVPVSEVMRRRRRKELASSTSSSSSSCSCLEKEKKTNEQMPDMAYFEVKILRGPERGAEYNAFVSVGLATRPYSPFHHIGWDRFSIAYHSDDGQIFLNSNQGGIPFSVPYNVGDTVGCGYIPSTGSVFFTLNGVVQTPPIPGAEKQQIDEQQQGEGMEMDVVVEDATMVEASDSLEGASGFVEGIAAAAEPELGVVGGGASASSSEEEVMVVDASQSGRRMSLRPRGRDGRVIRNGAGIDNPSTSGSTSKEPVTQDVNLSTAFISTSAHNNLKNKDALRPTPTPAATGLFHRYFASVGASREWQLEVNFGESGFVWERANWEWCNHGKGERKVRGPRRVAGEEEDVVVEDAVGECGCGCGDGVPCGCGTIG
ncbi:hypothetical protein HK102_003474, partial [Quaeritorhiza haematococci]